MNEHQHDANVAYSKAKANVARLERELDDARAVLASAERRRQAAILADRPSWNGTP